MQRRAFVLMPLAGLSGCSLVSTVLDVDLSKRDEEESRLDELSDQLLFVADTPELRRIRIQAMTLLLSKIVQFRALPDDYGVLLAIIKPLVKLAFSKDSLIAERPNTSLFYLRRRILSVAVMLAKDRTDGLFISPALDVDTLIKGFETLGLAKAVRADILLALGSKSNAEFSQWLEVWTLENVGKLEK